MPKLTVLVKYGNTEIYGVDVETSDKHARGLATTHLRTAFNRCLDEPELFETVYRV